ncbi:tautomerase family protein [Stenotrophomonas rhizophila]|uniref:tautomerase family protein n=1 Tax=Stenotrophomonas rhizophila TaxID=216778 RepID=UPI001E5C9DB9|nr:tautomerase family protein [Stenotrophomonas rhizophila]MCC7635399.1 tautomerase family protein [Stenotrophomonas rhizophila]MCC7664372.1 tautomerase family protein [Stenotrophomonas rhizophila]
MPFTRISLLAGRSPAYLRALTDALDRALVDSFQVPPHDRFVAVHPHAPGELLFDRDYRGGPRSDQYVLFHITTGKPRSAATKAAFYRQLVDELERAPGIPAQDVMVVIAESGWEDWSFGGGISAADDSAATP